VNPLTIAALFSVVLAFVVILFLVVSTYNDVVALERRTDKAWANIGVALKQRYDELPNLVNAVRGVMSFEQQLLTDVTRLRAQYAPAAPIRSQAETCEATTAAIRQLFAVVERYPALKSEANVLALQNEIERLENVIADRRELYNDQVYRLNTTIGQLPAAMLAPLFGWRPRTFFSTARGERGAADITLAASEDATPSV
jgi:LemA protein